MAQSVTLQVLSISSIIPADGNFSITVTEGTVFPVSCTKAELLQGLPITVSSDTIDRVTVTSIDGPCSGTASSTPTWDVIYLTPTPTPTITATPTATATLAPATPTPTGSPATATAGTFDLDVDSNGRWSVERFKGLLFNIERDANHIAQDTRRGKGNIIVCSADVASALAMAGVLDYAPALSTSLNVDDTGNTFAGVLNGRFRVYVDPYSANLGASSQFYVVGYKGSSPYDAGLFYCPYVPLQMVRAVDPNSFQPKIGFKTRYGLIANPYVVQANGTVDADTFTANRNQYYRRTKVTNLM